MDSVDAFDARSGTVQAEGVEVPRQPFIVIFRGPPGDVLPEGMRELHIEDGPSFKLYIIPVLTPQRDRQNYQSVFN